MVSWTSWQIEIWKVEKLRKLENGKSESWKGGKRLKGNQVEQLETSKLKVCGSRKLRNI
jgi:hypothetical protein